MAELTSYSFANVSLLIGDQKATGLWEGDDAVTIEPFSQQVGTPIVGVDGNAIVSRTVNNAVKITISAMPNGSVHKALTNKLRSIESNLISEFSVSVTDTGNGEGGASAFATIIEKPSVSFGEKATVRKWVLFANAWETNSIDYSL